MYTVSALWWFGINGQLVPKTRKQYFYTNITSTLRHGLFIWKALLKTTSKWRFWNGDSKNHVNKNVFHITDVHETILCFYFEGYMSKINNLNNREINNENAYSVGKTLNTAIKSECRSFVVAQMFKRESY